MSGDDAAPGALSGLLVIDLTIARAGPTCVRQLSDMGAEVVRIEHPRRADLSGSDAANLHRNKRSIVLDLKQQAGREVLLRLAERADVLVENFRAPVKAKLGIDYETLRAVNPRLVYASLSGFGQDGPYAERPAVDQIVQGMSGLMSVTGAAGSGPWRTGLAISDSTAGTFLAQGVIAALYERERTGQGQWVHTSLLEALVNFMDFQAARWLIDGQVPQQQGNDHPTIFPMGTFRAADGWINIAPALGFEAFARAVGAPEWLEDERFADAGARNRHRDALRDAIEAKLAAASCAEWVERINAAGVPCGPVLGIDEVFADPQVQHLKLSEEVEHALQGTQALLRHPVTFSRTPTSIRQAAPEAGRDTRTVLLELGYGSDEVDALQRSGAAGVRREEQAWDAR